MSRDHRIVYIRAIDKPPLYVLAQGKHDPIGKYFPIEYFYFTDEGGSLVSWDPYLIRVGDIVRIRYVNPHDKRTYFRPIEVDVATSFSDDPRLGRLFPDRYVFAE